jgi:gliding motility-associated-like protein
VADVQDLPDFTYLRRATVVNDYTVYTRCLIDTASDIAYYRIARKTWPGGYSDTLATFPLPGTTNTLEFTDSTAQTTSTSYEYTYLLIDKCNLPSGISNVGRTIFLQGKADDGFVNRLQWNAYADWEAGVLSYEVFRSRDGGISYESLGTVGLETRYNDAVVALLDTQLRFCYQIRAIEQLGNSFNVRDTSWSNVLCVDQKPTWYIPSAFVPRDGVRNTEFKPIGLYESVARKHEFTIYNRWGERIFSTTDPKQAWDGTYKSSYVPNGVYVYHLKFELPDGTRVDERGAVMLID